MGKIKLEKAECFATFPATQGFVSKKLKISLLAGESKETTFVYDEKKKEYVATSDVEEEYSKEYPLKITLYYNKFLTPPIGCIKCIFYFSQITKTNLYFFASLLK